MGKRKQVTADTIGCPDCKDGVLFNAPESIMAHALDPSRIVRQCDKCSRRWSIYVGEVSVVSEYVTLDEAFHFVYFSPSRRRFMVAYPYASLRELAADVGVPPEAIIARHQSAKMAETSAALANMDASACARAALACGLELSLVERATIGA